ncbi:uncharacterized protein LOC111382527 [Olea europaea var. sylvestris]|uniref:uncharacterized protein LOC111382527 n=1 Tax=Olea europaea var. sylvestris TaxID=158386 RepID=UPI000C1D662C|nr:uncharacterized protein LOC111382527 [Olea europaea var. sylvestris]
MRFSDEQVNFIQNGSRNFNPFSQTYNSGWRQHPNFRWSDNQQESSSKNNQLEKKTKFGGDVRPIYAEDKQEIHVKRPDRKDKEVMDEEVGTEVESEQPTNEEDKGKERPTLRAPCPLKSYFAKFVEIFKNLHINIPFADVIAQMPSHAKFLKEILSNKRELEKHETVRLNEEYSTSVNLMSLSVYMSLGLGEAKPTTISLQLADRSIKRPKGIIEDVLVKEDSNIPLILGRPFLATGRALIDVYNGKMILRVDNEQVIFNMFKAMKHPLTSDTCCQVDVLEELMVDTFEIEHQIILCEAEIAQSRATSAEKLNVLSTWLSSQ